MQWLRTLFARLIRILPGMLWLANVSFNVQLHIPFAVQAC